MKVWLTAAVLVLFVFVVLTAAESNETNIESDKVSAHLKYMLEYGEIGLKPIPAGYEIKIDGIEIKSLSNSQATKQQEINGLERNLQRLPFSITGTIVTDAPLEQYQVKQLEALGVEIRSEMDTLNTADIPRDAIDDIAELEFVRFIEPSQPVRLFLDAAVPEIGVGLIQIQQNASGKTYTGKDVIIGIVDTGIDTTHGDFWFDSSKTKSKILYLWDQTDTFGRSPSGYSYGIEYTKAEIEAGICRETDPMGHGTHVAGIAASSGKESGKYSGVAKDANIIFVKTTFNDAEIIDGLHYIVDKSKATGLPTVISCSFGAYFDSHDGSSPLTQAVEWCIGQGVPVVCSAGNDGGEELHATIDGPDPYGGTYNSGDVYNLEVELDLFYKDSLVDLYYDLDDNLSVKVSTANGSVYANETDALGSGSNWAIAIYYSETPTYKNYFIYAKDTHELCNQVIEINVDTERDRGNNRWDAWMLSEAYYWGSFADINDRDCFKTIGSPADSSSATTVGAYSTKINWTSVDGDNYEFSNAILNDIAYFSSHGPTRDNKMKPEITASGFGVMSALSIDALPYTHEARIDPDNTHKIASGTSMSAPIVAGVYALYLECNPKATPYEIKNYFMNAAREDEWTGTATWPKTHNQFWGAGKIWAQIISSEIEVDKTVFNLDTEEWVKEITADVTEEVKFNLTVSNLGLCSNLTNITLIDVLPSGLEYIGVESETPEPNEIIPGPDGTTILRWLIERPLEPKETIVFSINANVTECGVFRNNLNATAIADKKIVFDRSQACLDVFCEIPPEDDEEGERIENNKTKDINLTIENNATVKIIPVKEINKTTDIAKENNCTNMTKIPVNMNESI